MRIASVPTVKVNLLPKLIKAGLAVPAGFDQLFVFAVGEIASFDFV
jgi:hypothetical protein